MRFIIAGFLILLLSAFLGLQLIHDPGSVLISIHHWTIETTLWFAILCLILSFVLIHGLLVFCHYLSSLPRRIKQWKIQRNIHQAQALTRKGLIEFSEGYWDASQKNLVRALPFADTPLINYLTAARAAQELGDNQKRDDFLREAQQSMPETKIAVELTQAQLQIAHQQWEQALATLTHLQRITPKHPHVLKLLMFLYQEIHDWPQLIKLLPLLKKEKILNRSAFEHVRIKTYYHAIQELVKYNQKDQLTVFIAELPHDLKTNPQVLIPYLHFLIKINDFILADKLIRLSLKKEFNEELMFLYSQFFTPNDQLGFAESFLKKEPNSSVLYLCLGRLCLKNQLWGKAQTYLEKSIELSPSLEAYRALGDYYTQIHQGEKATLAYQAALNFLD